MFLCLLPDFQNCKSKASWLPGLDPALVIQSLLTLAGFFPSLFSQNGKNETSHPSHLAAVVWCSRQSVQGPCPPFQTGSHIAQTGPELPRLSCVAEDDPELVILLPLAPECWGCRLILLYSVLRSAGAQIQDSVCARQVVCQQSLGECDLSVSSVLRLE